ncbi:MAG: carboxypeptidase regulatory-like domain-containing protein [Acidobacteriia bacterium]|nr:carboxypeptidase regulatory-like domain-containing protein [Terriglobia bacterium]
MQELAWRTGQRARNWAWAALVVICLLGCVPISAWAQVTSGSLTGVVTDPTSAVVPAANVVLTDTNKGYDYTGTTDATGRYLITNLPSGTYKMAVNAPGFKSFTQTDIVITIGARLSADVRLEIGASAQTVEVVGAPPILSTQDAVTGQILTRTEVQNLPLFDRNELNLVRLAPGILMAAGQGYGPGYDINFVSNGMRNSTNDMLVDGITVVTNDPGSGVNTLLYLPPQDSVQELKVVQNNYTAEQGYSGNAYINMSIRSGTNNFHGSLFEQHTTSKLGANDWFANASGAGPGIPYGTDEFGGSIGGPIKKNKTFFFFDYDGRRSTYALTLPAGVPSAAERAGDFSELCGRRSGTFDANGICSNPNGQLWDPYSGTYFNGTVPGTENSYSGRVLQTPIPFNNLATFQSAGNPNLNGTPFQLPATPGNLIDPVSYKMMQFYPLPNLNVGSPAYNPYYNYSHGGSGGQNNDWFDIRIDHRFSDKTAFYARYSHMRKYKYSMHLFENALDPIMPGPGRDEVRSFALGLNHTFTPTTLLNVSLGFSRYMTADTGMQGEFPNFDPVTTLGLPSYIKTDGPIASPRAYISGYVLGGIGQKLSQGYRNGNQVYHLLSTLTQIRGRHELKFGGEWRVNQMNFFQDVAPAGYENFDYNGTSQYLWNATGQGVGGDSMATFLTGLGAPGAGGGYQISPYFSNQSHRWGLFIQDTWRATDKLTVNIGLRYDLEMPRTERYNRLSWFDATQSLPIHPAAVDAASWPSILPMPDVTQPMGGLVFGSNALRTQVDPYYRAFGPRLGLAYRLRNKLVLRTGYGLFYMPTTWGTVGSGPGGAEGFTGFTPWLSTRNADGVTPWGRMSNPFPDGLVFPTGPSLGALTNLGLGITEPERNANFATPSSQSWSAGFQYELPGQWLIDANYVGTKGTHLYYGGAGSMQYFGTWIEEEATNPALVNALNTYVPNPYHGVINTYGCAMCGPTIQAYRLLLPYPQFNGLSGVVPPWANSVYHSFQLKAEKRLSNGLQMLITYTNSKSIDDASVGTVSWLGGFPAMRDPNNLKAERSLSEWDVPQLLQVSYIWEFPFGRGKKWGSSWNSVLNGFLGGWQTAGMWRFDSGQPVALSVSGATCPLTYNCGNPNQTGVLRVNPKSKWFTEGYFANANDVLSVPAPYTIGSAPRTEPNVRVPGTNNATLGVSKEFSLQKVREGTRLQLRMEAYNALNHPVFDGIGTTFNQGSFGTVSSLSNTARMVTVALRVTF